MLLYVVAVVIDVVAAGVGGGDWTWTHALWVTRVIAGGGGGCLLLIGCTIACYS